MNDRAKDSRLAAAVASYDKYFALRAAETGRYTDSSGASDGCLGTLEDYPATDLFPAGVGRSI